MGSISVSPEFLKHGGEAFDRELLNTCPPDADRRTAAITRIAVPTKQAYALPGAVHVVVFGRACKRLGRPPKRAAPSSD
jgi:hypothetical protein